jgi:hypothetical protein
LVAADFLVFDLSRSRSPAYHVFTSGITQIKAQGITLPFHLPSLFRFFFGLNLGNHTNKLKRKRKRKRKRKTKKKTLPLSSAFSRQAKAQGRSKHARPEAQKLELALLVQLLTEGES